MALPEPNTELSVYETPAVGLVATAAEARPITKQRLPLPLVQFRFIVVEVTELIVKALA